MPPKIGPSPVDRAARNAATLALARANHTGTQAIGTINGLQTALDGKQAALAFSPADIVLVDGSRPFTGRQDFAAAGFKIGSDLRAYRSGTKTQTIDDGANGAVTLAVVGNVNATGNVNAANFATSTNGIVNATFVGDPANSGPYLYMQPSGSPAMMLGRGSASAVTFAVRAMASQTGDIEQWQNSAAQVLAKVDYAGVLSAQALKAANDVFQVSTGGDVVGRYATFAQQVAGPSILLGGDARWSRSAANVAYLDNGAGSAAHLLLHDNAEIRYSDFRARRNGSRFLRIEGTDGGLGHLNVNGTINGNVGSYSQSHYVSAGSATTVASTVQTAVSATANAVEVKNSGGTTVMKVSPAGTVTITDGSTPFTMSSGSAYSYINADQYLSLGAGVGNSGAMTFNVNNAQKAIINAVGLGIGATPVGTYKLVVGAVASMAGLPGVDAAIKMNAAYAAGTSYSGLVVQAAADDSFIEVTNNAIRTDYGGSGSYQPITVLASGNQNINLNGSSNVVVGPNIASAVKLTVKAATSHTANAQEWQSSAGSVLANVTAAGSVRADANVWIGSAGSGYPGVWVGQATPSTSNYALLGLGSDTFVNAPAGGSVVFRVNNATTGQINATSIESNGYGRFGGVGGQTNSVTVGFAALALGPGISFGLANDTWLTRSAAGEITQSASAGSTRSVVKMVASQTAAPFEVQSSSAAVVAAITAAGLMNLGGSVFGPQADGNGWGLHTGSTLPTTPSITLRPGVGSLYLNPQQETGYGPASYDRTLVVAARPSVGAALFLGHPSAPSYFTRGVVEIGARNAGDYPLVVRAASGATVDTISVRDAADAVVASITPTGRHKWAAGNVQTTVGAAGGASAPPASPTRYLKVVDSDGTTLVVPAYAAA